jgi:hypothetical protein
VESRTRNVLDVLWDNPCLLLLAIAAYIVFVIPVVLLAAISPALIFLGILAMFCGLIYLMISVSMTYIVGHMKRKVSSTLLAVHSDW